ncbi:MAG: hypothetical protein IT196_19890 [Acidimicrobiales bacterium]|nr:hypothetical protein [Acidimicrobiales bacterium]
MGTWLGRIGLVWLLASMLTMFALSALVFLGSRRKRLSEAGPKYLTFDAPAQLYQLSPRRGSEYESYAEPAISHPVSADSGALDRLLAGVALPCELERLHLEGEDERERMAFHTKGYEPREVAVSVVDELERMGMDIEPLSYTEARAFRDGFEIAVSIFTEPNRVIRDRRLAFPGADPRSVVIEFSVV